MQPSIRLVDFKGALLSNKSRQFRQLQENLRLAELRLIRSNTKGTLGSLRMFEEKNAKRGINQVTPDGILNRIEVGT